ncbi:hypothetical protein SALBM311S_07128 [Streptomyces alboniger]
MEMAPAPETAVGQHEDSVDLRIGGVTVRLVSPLSGRSRYAEAGAARRAADGVCLVVDELNTALGQLEDEGVTVVERAGPQARRIREHARPAAGVDRPAGLGGNVQVVSAPDGWPIWVSPVRPGREHDTTCARTHGLVDALNRLASTLDIPTLTDLGYENAGDGFRHPVKRPNGSELDDEQQAFNSVIRGVHAVAERANALLKVTFKALRRVSLDPSGITLIARAALVLLQLEHGRTA